MAEFLFADSMFAHPRYLPPSAWTGHLPFASWLIERCVPEVVVELGTHAGASYMGFCQAVYDHGLSTRCFAVDTWQGDEHAGYYGDEIYRVLKSDHDRDYAGFSQMLRMTFDDASSQFTDGSIDVLHIDGLHTYEAVRHDFETWLPKLSARSVVLFHDTAVRERNFGVWKLWAELRERYPGFEFTHASGLGVLMVSEEMPPPLRALAAAEADGALVHIRRLFENLGNAIETDLKRQHFERSVVIRDRELGQTRVAFDTALEERNALSAELQAARDDVAAREIHRQQAASAYDEALAAIDTALEERNALSAELQAARDDVAAREIHRQQAASAYDEALAATDTALQERNALSAELQAAQGNVMESDLKRGHFERLVVLRDRELGETRAAFDTALEERNALSAELQATRDDVAALETHRQQVASAYDEALAAMEIIRRDAEAQRARADQARIQNDRLIAARDAAEHESTELRLQIAALRGSHMELIADARAEQDRLRRDIAAGHAAFVDIEAQMRASAENERLLMLQNDDARRQAGEKTMALQRELDALSTEMALVYGSRSWRLTRGLRWLRSTSRGTRK